ncbi:trimethyllysine dioxygenase, mitochondrial-like [Haliotis rubra]|uniref:trimethyllysine dioxygenase, mitochondrial-like n=1 Tax=Haliotis rubra TaxID=36100 RepID=UPI001EE55049|nr:trimethyllysine dioxygenase, mitochondrial-like [Haliotis rubra]
MIVFPQQTMFSTLARILTAKRYPPARKHSQCLLFLLKQLTTKSVFCQSVKGLPSYANVTPKHPRTCLFARKSRNPIQFRFASSVSQKDDGYLLIQYRDKEVELPYIWLRDHCRCEICYNHTTSQKNVDNYTLSDDLTPKSTQLVEDGEQLRLEWPDGHLTHFDLAWLVEHSYSTVSKSKTPFYLWDKESLQREPLPVVPYDAYNDDSGDGIKKTLQNLLKYGFSVIDGVSHPGELAIIVNVWPDGHLTHFDLAWLVEHSYSTVSKSKTPFYLWDKESLQREPLPVVPYDAYNDDSGDGIKKTLQNLLKYGFSVIDGVEASIKDTQETVERITFLQESVFGRMWSFTSDLQRSDTAYTNLFLGAHTDTTYLNLPAGIQVFHCLWHDGKGGDTLLVDGFHAAEQFRRDHPEDFQFLTQVEISHEYKEWNRNHILSHGTILRVHPGSNDLMLIRFNPYDMAPLDTLPPRDIPRFYSAYSKLASYIKNPANEFWLKLHPGMVLLVNNWRVLHGRASFSGRRVVCGCYLPRDDWMNKARVFNLV